MMKIPSRLLSLVLLCSTAHAAPGPALLPRPSAPFAQDTDDEGLFGEVQESIAAEIERGAYRGAVALIEAGGERLLETAQGIQNVAGERPMTMDTIFRIYSMSKPITVAAAMLLVDEGKLSLDAPVSKYLPAFKDLTVGIERAPLEREMSVRDLMRHTSGLTYGIFATSAVDTLVEEADVLNPNKTLADMVAALAKLPLKHQPGRTFEYGLSIDVLGRVVEVIAQKPFAEFLDERLFVPLGMQDTGFYVKPDQIERLADLNSRVGGQLKAAPEGPGTTHLPALHSGGGGLFSTAEDYLAFATMLLHDGEHAGQQILSRTSTRMMRSNQMAGISAFSFGLGGSVINTPSQVGPAQGSYSWGGLAGTHFWIDPQEDLISIFMIQNMAESAHAERFMRLAYKCIGR